MADSSDHTDLQEALEMLQDAFDANESHTEIVDALIPLIRMQAERIDILQ